MGLHISNRKSNDSQFVSYTAAFTRQTGELDEVLSSIAEYVEGIGLAADDLESTEFGDPLVPWEVRSIYLTFTVGSDMEILS